MLEKTFNPVAAEPRLYRQWEESGAFAPIADPAAETFSIVIPPPNVTGSLHIGHALNNTLQDVLIRFARMRGLAALWLPGTDHAGIATQMVVERQLAAQGNIGRRDARPSSSASGPGRRSQAARSSTSCAASARPATGAESASPWTRACRRRCARSSSPCIGKS
jgi:leucyl-tRNA synthetase